MILRFRQVPSTVPLRDASLRVNAFCVACGNRSWMHGEDKYSKSSLLAKPPFSIPTSSADAPDSTKRWTHLNSSHNEYVRQNSSKFSLQLHSQSPKNSSHASSSDSYLSVSREEIYEENEEGEIVYNSFQALASPNENLESKENYVVNGVPKVNGNAHSLKRSNKTLKVAVDVDEVLCSFLSTLNIFCAEKYNALYELEEYFVYDFSKVWKCSQAEANARVHAFFDSHHFNNGIPPIPGALETLQRVSDYCELFIVTSRQHVIQEPTLEWVEKHYPGIFKAVHFGNHFALEGPARPKSDICKEVGAHILIDDNPKYAMECAEHGIQVLLFDWRLAYPWSKTSSSHPLITRVRDWHEVESSIQHRISVVENNKASKLEA